MRPDLNGAQETARLRVGPGGVVGEALSFLFELGLEERPLGKRKQAGGSTSGGQRWVMQMRTGSPNGRIRIEVDRPPSGMSLVKLNRLSGAGSWPCCKWKGPPP